MREVPFRHLGAVGCQVRQISTVVHTCCELVELRQFGNISREQRRQVQQKAEHSVVGGHALPASVRNTGANSHSDNSLRIALLTQETFVVNLQV